MKHYMSSFIFAAIVMALGFSYGLIQSGLIGALQVLLIITVLSALEISLSFDNAVANAKVLETMSPQWQQRFLTWGMVIAVFGMRVILPLVIVAIAGSIGIFEALNLAINEPDKYSAVLSEAEVLIKGFGGAFLLLVGLGFFLDEEKDTHWLKPIESRLGKIGALKSSAVVLTLVSLYLFSLGLEPVEAHKFIIAGVFGVIVHEIISSLGDLIGAEDSTTTVAKSGLIGFMYLEVLDASFSLDGVIAAFVLSNDIFIIAAGLGIGAMFVRSMTIHLVETGTLAEYRYLEHGAFWSILVLAFIMFAGTQYHISEMVTGLLSVAVIIVAVLHSVHANKQS